MPRLLASPAERIKARVEIDGAGCWQWRRKRDREGYGHIKLHGRDLLAHRASYEAFVGVIPAGLTLDHLCRQTGCVNPAHLEPVTNRENILRGNGVTAQAARKTHCPAGHPYDDANTWRGRRGERHCKTCRRLSSRAAKKKRSR